MCLCMHHCVVMTPWVVAMTVMGSRPARGALICLCQHNLALLAAATTRLFCCTYMHGAGFSTS